MLFSGKKTTIIILLITMFPASNLICKSLDSISLNSKSRSSNTTNIKQQSKHVKVRINKK